MSIFKTHRDYHVCVQCTLIALLNRQYSFSIERPVKKGNISLQLIKIRRIECNKDWIDVEAFITKRCQERMKYDISLGVPNDTAKQRISKNKLFEQIHLLIDLTFLMGYTFNSSFTNGANNSMVCETILDIYENKELLFNSKDIEFLGNKINQLIYGRLNEQHSVFIDKSDKEISELLQFKSQPPK